ncbi:MAG: hypothetical protein WCJ64_06140 [Rhodospirillaceae bacterium]
MNTAMKLVADAIGTRLLGKAIVALVMVILSFGSGRAAEPPAAEQPASRIVDAGIYVINIQELALAASTYKATFWLWFKSNDPKYEPEKAIDIIGAKDIKTDSLTLDKLSDGTYYRSVKVSATITQKYDVGYFPFDTQKLRIIVENTNDDVSKMSFKADTKSSGVDPNIVLPGWKLRGFDLKATSTTYNTDFGAGDGASSSYARLVATVAVEHAGGRIFGTNFLGFFVADLLTGVTMAVESFNITRLAVPFIGRLNMAVGSLFGAVGNSYLVEKMLPPTPNLTLTDMVQVSSFSSIAFALFTVIGSETLSRMAYTPAAVTAFSRTSVAVFLGSQLALGAYYIAHADQGK